MVNADSAPTEGQPGSASHVFSGAMGEDQVHDASEEGTLQKFSPPQNTTSEQTIFTNNDGEQRILVGGKADHDSVEPGTITSADIADTVQSQGDRRQRRTSSMDMRRSVPESPLLNAQNAIIDDMSMPDSLSQKANRASIRMKVSGCVNRIFLNPSYSLRKQMLLTFGTVSSLTILLVMIVAIIATLITGNSIKEKSSDIAYELMGTTSRHAAEVLSPKIMPNDLVQLLFEIARDRFAGYPVADNTPFLDSKSQTNIYPLENNPLPFDWDFRHTPNEKGNVNADNSAEHVQNRWSWYSSHPRMSTQSSTYTMQGACNPRETNSSAMGYYPNCTNANIDVSTGGVVAPNPTNEQVYRKAAAFSPFLKALYEYHQEIKSLGFYFGNSGAGSSTIFPHYELDSSGSYMSIGCEWMKTLNPIDPTLGPIGTDEEIARCHPEGAVVPTREYNPLERAWCREQALDPSRVHNIGPYLDAWSTDNIWYMSSGRAVYDIVTGAFVSCISVDFNLNGIEKILDEFKVDDLGILTVVRADDDTVVISPNFDLEMADEPTKIDDPSLETGVDQEMFDKIKSIVDFSQRWDPEDASRLFEEALFESDEHLITAHPIPSVPKEYDLTYVPEFFVIFSLPKAKGFFQIIGDASQEVDKSTKNIVLFTLLVGLVGLIGVTLLIFATSYWFVEPLKWMHQVGDQVVGKFGEELDTGIDYERKKSLPCSPKTELSSLVEEFTKMIAHFSGEGTAKRVHIIDTEKLNTFDFSDEFIGLYRSRSRTNSSFAFNYTKAPAASIATGGQATEDDQTLKPINLGQNIRLSANKALTSSTVSTTSYSKKAHKSPLFAWMVGLIVTPVLLTTVVISAVVLWRISNTLPTLMVPVKGGYLQLNEKYRFVATGMLATRASAVSEKAARDIHLLTRFASWLFFDAIAMSGSFTELLAGAEDCKMFPSELECKWAKDLPCDCAWNDFFVRDKKDSCDVYPSGSQSSRFLQRAFFDAQSQDAGPDGSRYSTSFPAVATTPNTTAWWDNVTVLPRSYEESSSSNYGSSYERAKTISALSAVFFPLYNYDTSNDSSMGIYIGFEDDGGLAGYEGCSYSCADLPFWRSTGENGGAQIRPELCPLGKYGYDARCRSWYDDGKKKAAAGNETSIHVTSPYLFSFGNELVGQSITSPLIDPRNQSYVGQVLIDFVPDSIFRALNRIKLSEGGFPIMITPERDVLGHDTVVGPGFRLDTEGKSIEELLLPDNAFKPILEDMKAGNRGEGVYRSNRTTSGHSDGNQVHISYAPVFVRSYVPLNSSDITRGVKENTILVYSLALAETESGIIDSFQSSINDFASKTVQICIGVLTALIVVATILIVYIAFRVTASMIEPLLQLLGVVKDINSMRISNDDALAKLSYHKGSCREVECVYKTMEFLYKVVQFANSAFFSGDLEVAFQVFKDSLRLFTRLDNKKAVAVASNNLGNTMLTIYRTMKTNDDGDMCGLSKTEVIEKGTAYYAHSIKLGEDSYDAFYNEQGWSEECLEFMQFLANRYFNRAIFFLTTSCDNENRKAAESLGFRDLQISADMDLEIVDQCLEMGFKINRVERYELMMSRIRGLLSLAELGYSTDELYIEDQITDLYRDLNNAMKNPGHELFKEISIAGRMQKLDTELIKYFSVAKQDKINAARVAIRMLIEDEYVFPDAEQEAIETLLSYLDTGDENCPGDEGGCIAKELGSEIEALELEYDRTSRSASSTNGSLRISTSLNDNNISKKTMNERSGGGTEDLSTKSQSVRRSLAAKQSSRRDITMELF